MASILMDVDAIIDLCRDHGEQGTLMHEVMVRMDPSYRRTSLGAGSRRSSRNWDTRTRREG